MNLEEVVRFNKEQLRSEVDDYTHERYLAFQRKFARETRDVLDVGCNTGRGGAALKQSLPALRITGLDCVKERLDALDPQVYSATILGFGHEIDSAAGQFDAIVAGEFIEHVPPDLVDRTLCEFFRVLRLKGRLLLTTPNPYYLRNRLFGLSVIEHDSHLTQHFPSILKQRAMAVGFSRVKIVGSGRMTRYLGSRFPYLPAYGSYMLTATKW